MIGIFRRPLIGWGLAVTAALILIIVMYNAQMSSKSSSKEKRQTALEVFPVTGQEVWWGDGRGEYATPTWDTEGRVTYSGSMVPVGPDTRLVTVSDLDEREKFFAVRKLGPADIPGLFSNEVAVTPENGFVRLGWDDGFIEPTVTPSPTETPEPIPTEPPSPTVAPTPTIPPTPTPSGTPRIITDPSIVVFTWVNGTAFPTPFPIQVTTSNGADWTSQDNSPWFDAHPTSGASGESATLFPHTNSNYPSWNITFSAPGLPSKIVKVSMRRVSTPSPTPSPIPSPTPCQRPTPPCPCPP